MPGPRFQIDDAEGVLSLRSDGVSRLSIYPPPGALGAPKWDRGHPDGRPLSAGAVRRSLRMFGGTGLRATSRREVAAGFADSWPRALASSSRRSLPALGAQGAGEGRRAAAEASGATRQHLLDLIIVIIAIAITRCCHVFSHGGSNGTSGRDLRLPRPAPPSPPSPAHATPAPPTPPQPRLPGAGPGAWRAASPRVTSLGTAAFAS